MPRDVWVVLEMHKTSFKCVLGIQKTSKVIILAYHIYLSIRWESQSANQTHMFGSNPTQASNLDILHIEEWLGQAYILQ